MMAVSENQGELFVNLKQAGSLQPQNFGAAAPAATQGGGVVAPPPRQRVRARRGQATDPHSIAERVSHDFLFLFFVKTNRIFLLMKFQFIKMAET